MHTRPVDKFINLTDPLVFPVGNNVIALKVRAFMLLSDTHSLRCLDELSKGKRKVATKYRPYSSEVLSRADNRPF